MGYFPKAVLHEERIELLAEVLIGGHTDVAVIHGAEQKAGIGEAGSAAAQSRAGGKVGFGSFTGAEVEDAGRTRILGVHEVVDDDFRSRFEGVIAMDPCGAGVTGGPERVDTAAGGVAG